MALIDLDKRNKNTLKLDPMSYKWRAESIQSMLEDKVVNNRVILRPSWSNDKMYVNLEDYKLDPDKYMNDLSVLLYEVHMVVCKNTEELKAQTILYKHNEMDRELNECSLIHFTYNFILWKGYFVLGMDVPREECVPFFSPKYFTNSKYVEHINKIIEYCKSETTIYEASKIASYMFDDFIKLVYQNGKFFGLTFGLNSIVDEMWDDEEIKDICHTEIPKDMQIAEAERVLKDKTSELYRLLLRPRYQNALRAMIEADEGINRRALREFMIHMGFKPSLDGNTIPITENTNLVTKGFYTPSAAMINSKGGIKAAFTALHISTGGYFQKELTKASAGIRLHPDPDFDCGSQHYVSIPIVSHQTLSDLHGRYYRTEENTIRQIINTDNHLIGQTLDFRSPCTCASDEVCRVCYGHMYYVNYGMDTGLISALILSHDNYQMTMAVKHLLDTLSKEFVFTQGFDKYFSLSNGMAIILRVDIDEYYTTAIRINRHDICKVREGDGIYGNEYITRYQVIDTETGEVLEVSEANDMKMFLADEMFTLYHDKAHHTTDEYITITLEELTEARQRTIDDEINKKKNFGETDDEDENLDISEDVVLFYIMTENAELTKPLSDLTNFVEKGKELSVGNVSELVNRLKELFYECNIKTPYLDIEIISRNLIRDRAKQTKRPDWTDEALSPSDYIITSVSKSILMSNSFATSISFGWIKDQMSSPLTYQKNGVSYLDPTFMP